MDGASLRALRSRIDGRHGRDHDDGHARIRDPPGVRRRTRRRPGRLGAGAAAQDDQDRRAVLGGRHPGEVRADCERLVDTLDQLVERNAIARLGRYGVTRDDLPRILDKANGKNSPAQLDRAQMAAILEARL